MTGTARDGAIRFDDGAAYERFMGRWSRAVGARFLEWLAPPADACWLEVGCGSGAFTRLLGEMCRPAAIVAVDPSEAQIRYARDTLAGDTITFHVAAAEMLPFQKTSHDIVVSALAINFMADKTAAVQEMRRVARPGGKIAGYVWDFATQRTPQGPLVRALARMGIESPAPPGSQDCAMAALQALFARAGLVDVMSTALDIEVCFANLAEFWATQMPGFSPTTQLVTRLANADRVRLDDAVRTQLTPGPDGSVRYPARAHAVKACVS
jgi:SAM-dependent methyltransferase